VSDIGEKLISIVRAKAEENPEFVYLPPGGDGTSCLYVHDGQPSCLIGQALWGAGCINAQFERNWTHNTERIDGIALALGLELDPAEIEWLGRVQDSQDNQAPWGRAVAAADRDLTLAKVHA
jgi:hypothetical protein